MLDSNVSSGSLAGFFFFFLRCWIKMFARVGNDGKCGSPESYKWLDQPPFKISEPVAPWFCSYLEILFTCAM